MSIRLFASESVTEGHPDKICDQISDSVLDACLEQDPMSRVACECFTTTGLVLVGGEISSNAIIDVKNIARNVLREVGYHKAEYGIGAEDCSIHNVIGQQSPDIAMGVDESFDSRQSAEKTLGAGDQGMMFGFACNETRELMPLPITLAHSLTERLAMVRKAGIIKGLRPDGKAQVTVMYDEKGNPQGILNVVVSAQHDGDKDMDTLRKEIKKEVVEHTLKSNGKRLLTDETEVFINPTGRFEIGGPKGDSGLTGRKIIVDTYGGYARHGGGAFSGKDATKVDRSAAYMARYVAKNLVAAEVASKCEIQVAYAIGVAYPVSLRVDTFGTGVVSDNIIEEAVLKMFDFRPAEMIKTLGLRRPIFRQTAAYGHFGKPGLPWEKLDRVRDIRLMLGV